MLMVIFVITIIWIEESNLFNFLNKILTHYSAGNLEIHNNNIKLEFVF